MPGPARQPRRSRESKPETDTPTPSGYRVTARQRFELGMAAQFLGTASLQDTIDLAVCELLERMREVEGFSAALAAAERSQQGRAGVRTLPRSAGEHDADPQQVAGSEA